MPNICANKLCITGSTEDIARFAATFTDNIFTFSQTHPIPEGTENRYEWCLSNWGTKLDVDGDPEVSDGHIMVRFDTAWNPPIQWAMYVSGLYPGLVFELFFSEPGLCIFGTSIIQDGRLHTKNYAEDYQEFLSEHFNEEE